MVAVAYSDGVEMSKKKVFVAMSGGVDSSVAAALLRDDGYEVVGVTMCFSIEHPDSRRPSCCGVDGIQDAQRVTQILGIPHYVLDFAGDIREFIIDPFVREYLRGRTPNPCVRCNQYLKFGTLYRKVMGMGADFLATGHYLRNEFSSQTGQFVLKTAVDRKKDQSYFLYNIPKAFLPRLLFPLGGMTKDEVRRVAARYGLNTAAKPESQDICFVPETGYKQFIRDRVGEEAFIPGEFIDHRGEVVGRHQGIANYTIGQRQKLGLALGYPAYVYHIDADRHVVRVGPRECLFSRACAAREVCWVGPSPMKENMEVQARIRYNAPRIKAFLRDLREDRLRVVFDEPQMAVTPGQSVVFYQGEVILGGAVIDESSQED